MPKGKKNKGKFEHRRTEQPYSSDEDAGIDMTNDNCSETSGQSDLKSIEAENEAQEKFEEKVMEVVDALSARSNAARASALVSLRCALERRYLCDLLSGHRATLADHLARALRRGRDAERKAAAQVPTLLALQLGEEGTEEFVKEVRPALFATCIDKSASIETRAECCSSLAIFCYLLEEDLNEIFEVMRMFETIFSGSYLKGDGTVKTSGVAVEEGTLHAAALDGWALLLAALGGGARGALRQQGGRLGGVLSAPSVEVRMAAGGALAIAHETITDEDEEDQELADQIEQVLPRLAELARESHKYRAKKDRKIQRATFRDILKYFEEGTVPVLSVRVGSVAARLDTWSQRLVYSALATALGGALSMLADRVDIIRQALLLPEVPDLPKRSKNKLERHLQNTAACKARTLARNKNRDKRSAALAL